MRSLPLENYKAIFALKRGELPAWRIAKCCLVLIWLPMISSVLLNYTTTSPTSGVCSWFPCQIFTYRWINIVFTCLTILFAFTYILNIRPALSASVLAGFSFLIFSYQEANGVYPRTATLSAIFLAQAVAYIFDPAKPSAPLLYSRQIIAATYTLSGLSKLMAEGPAWFLQGKYLLLQIKKGAYYWHFDNGGTAYLERQNNYVEYFSQHPFLMNAAMLIVMCAELTAGLMLLSARMTLIYGLLLLGIHIGIRYFMDIIIEPIAFPMVILLINPVYRIVQLGWWIDRKAGWNLFRR